MLNKKELLELMKSIDKIMELVERLTDKQNTMNLRLSMIQYFIETTYGIDINEMVKKYNELEAKAETQSS